MKRYLTAMLVLLGLIGIGLAGSGSGASADRGDRLKPPPGDTIVRVEGDAANGFGIHYYDGSALFPPTQSESRAECDEYDRRADRIRCRVQMRTWYRDLADLKQALTWAERLRRLRDVRTP